MLPYCQLLRDGNEELVSEHAETDITLHKVHHLETRTHQTSSTVEQIVLFLSKLPLTCSFPKPEKSRYIISSLQLTDFQYKNSSSGTFNYFFISINIFHYRSMWPIAQVMSTENNQQLLGDGEIGVLKKIKRVSHGRISGTWTQTWNERPRRSLLLEASATTYKYHIINLCLNWK